MDLIISAADANSGLLSFDVEIINHKQETVIVSPELFRIIYLDEKMQPVDKYTPQMAIDPEEKLLELNKSLAREQARYAQESGNKALVSLMGLASDLAAINKAKSDEEKERQSLEHIEQDLQDMRDDNYHARVKYNLNNEKDRWAFAALRKTTLPTDWAISGRIYFKIAPYCRCTKIVFDEEGENLNAMFRVDRFNPISKINRSHW